MKSTPNSSAGSTGQSLLVLASSFIAAFGIQVTVHELGHYFAGLVCGAQNGKVFLHPFYNSQVVFTSIGGLNSQVWVGVMGIVADLVLAVGLSLLVWKRKSPLFLPILLWGSLAFIGEGIGMIGNLSAYYQTPRYIEDIAQLLRIGVSPIPIWAACVVCILIGLIWMALIMPTAGISSTAPFILRLAAYVCCMPLYFGLAVLFINVFPPTDRSILDVRMMQLEISLVLALILALLHRPIHAMMNKMIRPRDVNQLTWSNVGMSLGLSAVVFGALLAYSHFFN